MKQNDNTVGFEIKAYTKKDMRIMYGIPEATFRRWLKALPETGNTGRKNWLSAIQVEAIIKAYGVPGAKVVKHILL